MYTKVKKVEIFTIWKRFVIIQTGVESWIDRHDLQSVARSSLTRLSLVIKILPILHHHDDDLVYSLDTGML